MQNREDQIAAEEQEDGQAEVGILQQEHQPLVQEVDDDHDAAQQEEPPIAALVPNAVGRQLPPLNDFPLHPVILSASKNNHAAASARNDHPNNHQRQDIHPRIRNLNEAAVERTSIPEQHNDLHLPESDDDSQGPTPASWTTVITYGASPPSERSRKSCMTMVVTALPANLTPCLLSSLCSPRRCSFEQRLVYLWWLRWLWSS